MATTGTYDFNPAASDLTIAAFDRIGIRATEVTAQHMATALREANLVQVEMSNRLPNLFAKETYSFGLSFGTATYTLPFGAPAEPAHSTDAIGERMSLSGHGVTASSGLVAVVATSGRGHSVDELANGLVTRA